MVGKSIGIVTFHRSHNCGSILQAYAMQKILIDRGFEPEFINLSTVGQREVYSIFQTPRLNGGLVECLKTVYRNFVSGILYARRSRNKVSYDKYISRHLRVSTGDFFDSNDISKTSKNYDLYLTGSDQVWNVSIEDYDSAYFLDFVKNRPKIAYAVSQGAKDIGKYAVNPKEIASQIRDIDHVSVREENGQKWLRDLTGRQYPVVLDPTLLLDSSDYRSIEEVHGIASLRHGEYIFVYASPLSKTFLRRIRKYAKKHNLKVVVWHDGVWFKRFGWLFGVICPKLQTPGKYLSLIKDARFVCTSSFHGVVLSATYRKDFVVLENSGMIMGEDDRMTGFLHRVGLSGRIVSESDFEARINNPIEYSDFVKTLAKLRVESLQFLQDALGGAK